tara:strand:- start:4 stop:237 length:234 start_codon:yes stop_codon:yes gene_type:complete
MKIKCKRTYYDMHSHGVVFKEGSWYDYYEINNTHFIKDDYGSELIFIDGSILCTSTHFYTLDELREEEINKVLDGTI